MDYEARRAAWDRINERLQYFQKPCTNEANVKGRGFPVSWVFWSLVIVAITAAVRGW